MIMHLLSDTAAPPCVSALSGGGSGLALRLVDELGLEFLLVLRRRRDVLLDNLLVARLGHGAASQRTFDARHQVAHNFLADVEAALELEHGRRRRIELDDEIRALAVLADGIRQPAAAPRADLDDLPLGGGDRARGAVDHGLDLIVRRVGAKDEHQLITAQVDDSFPWDVPRSPGPQWCTAELKGEARV